MSSYKPSITSSTGVPDFSPIIRCKCLHLSQSAAGRTFQRTTMLSSCLQAQHSISNSVKDGSYVAPNTGWPIFLQALLHFCFCISIRPKQFWVKMYESVLVFPFPHWGAC